MTRPSVFLVLAGFLLIAGSADAAVTLANAWMRPAAAGDSREAYVDIRSDAALKLVAATTPAARTVEIVVQERSGDSVASRVVPAFDIPADAPTRFAYRGNVLRLVGINRLLANDTPVPLTLEFRTADGSVVKATTDVQVRGLVAPRAKRPQEPQNPPSAEHASESSGPASTPPARATPAM